ncbi:putative acyl-CoA thioesterase [Bradyrhizobium sp. STM 3843]|uniref:GDSL-type esterase/lipase family protein n=1 Tax=Bradyrhizobium sp. STM 3843 TaxID=551947 RepID=UPI0002403540|nr:GDSL-type esterase/lipase family protein [Bradyrhizobium sp. STM 3843]CCE08368.1 putative acyl-CoA thioesterase [Bradyrhizobium sp. STM 3843]
MPTGSFGRQVRRQAAALFAACCFAFGTIGAAQAAEVVALGASNTYGKGVNRGEDFPAQLEAMLHAKGLRVSVTNAGVNGDTTAGMLSRFDGAVDGSTRVLLLQPGGNDFRKGVGDQRAGNVSAILAKASQHHIRVVMVENGMLRGLPHQMDGVHLTPDGYRMLAAALLPRVTGSLRR